MLRHVHLCSSCQLHQRVRQQLFALRQARRGFSSTTSTAQQYRDSIVPRFSPPSYQTPPPTRRSEHDGAATTRQYRGHDVPRGRYSGQPLQPEQVLSQLSGPRANDIDSQNPASWPIKRVDFDPRIDLPESLQAKLQELSRLRSLGVTPAGEWPLMQDMMREKGAERLHKHRNFVKAYIDVVYEAIDTLKGGHSQARFGPRSSDVLAFMPHFDSQAPAILDEMTAVWNLALAARLQRWRPDIPPSAISRRPAKLDWTFLPSLPAFTQMLAQQQRGAPALQFRHGLAMLLPERANDNALGVKNEGVSDYDSSALIMIDVLRQAPTTLQQKYQSPFIELLEVLLRTLPSADELPLMIERELHGPTGERSPVRRVLELVVERFGLVYTPRRQAQKAQTQAERVEGPREREAQPAGEGRHGVAIKQEPSERDATVPASGPAKISQGPGLHGTPQTAQERRRTLETPTRTQTEQSRPQQRGKVLFRYESAGEGELTVSEGKSIVLLEEDSGDGWIKVRVGNKEDAPEAEGFVPASYVELVEMVGDAAAVQQDDSGVLRTAGPAKVLSEVAPTPEDAAALGTSPRSTAVIDTPGDDPTGTPAAPATVPDTHDRDAIADRFTNLRMNRLGQAVQKQDLALAEHLKREILTFAADPSNPPLRDQLFEHLMLTLLSLRNPTSAIEVWNYFGQHLEKLGRQPTVKTYTVMMKGAQQVRDGQGMEAFWGKMRAAGVPPDVNAWTTRIFGLIKGGRVDDGLRALSDFGGEWVNAAREKHAAETARGGGPKGRKGRSQGQPAEVPALSISQAAALYGGDIEGTPRPTIAAMNAAITALALRADRHITKVLTWGRAFGLEPDKTTYNTLLNVSFHHGEADQAMAILQRMREKGIETTGDTWTVLLTQVFEGRTLDGLAPEEQKDRVLTLIEAAGAGSGGGVDIKGYTLAIDRLLKLYNNTDAANAVLAHMSSRASLQPTPHLYTIFMAYYFQQQPTPNFQAIEALWQQIQAVNSGRGAPLDSVFYDRMLEGYSRHHGLLNSTQQVQHLLQRMRNEGRRPSWRALEAVARALAERGEWGVLLRIVDEARAWLREDKGAATEEMLTGSRNFGQVDFWQFVVATGLLMQEGVTSVEQLMRTRTGLTPMERRMGVERQRRSP
ncbi:hypothetical protein B0A55_07341 [Friedmanniomyces simplex]|uniref:SH3 domain-containing protein n=1 Tax=Friedmanniomyces simplex TaxID=329884 RepID=A0A4U0X721_9PEZI|nr:hypothetical protein B0A55_07341 [Friedmanniomyces simplex]